MKEMYVTCCLDELPTEKALEAPSGCTSLGSITVFGSAKF